MATSSSKSYKLNTLLRTSNEARRIYLKHYQLIHRKCLGLSPLYVDFSRDTLAFEDFETLLLFLGMKYLDTEYIKSLSAKNIRATLQRLGHPMLKELRYLAIGSSLNPMLRNILPVFQKLVHIATKEYMDRPWFASFRQAYLSMLMARVKELMKTWKDVAGREGYDFTEPEFEFLGDEFCKRYEFKIAKKLNDSVC